MTLKMRLTVRLKDGRIISGSYPYLLALARKEFAESLPDCVAAILEDE